MKRFVILGHKEGFALCIKATTKIDIYKNNPEKMVGCVYYEANKVKFFKTNTVIQPDNPFPIPHSHIYKCANNGTLQVLGTLPADFKDKLKVAIHNSSTLNKERKLNLVELLK